MTFGRFQSTLSSFVEHRSKFEEIINLEQTDVDKIIRPAHGAVQEEVRIPKSIDPLTLEKVEEEIKKLNDDGINAEVMGGRVGVSRTTARRYLEFLVSKGTVKPNLVYGSVGRPERLYFQTAQKV